MTFKLLAVAACLSIVVIPGQSSSQGNSSSGKLQEVTAIVAAATYPLSVAGGEISGPGADLLLRRTADAQFVLLGESHHDRDTPIFAGALFDRLRSVHNFGYLAVEQDPVAMETVGSPTVRGKIDQIAGLAKRYPTHIGFSSDQDLQLLAKASASGSGRYPTVWGIEQAQGADRYLEELSGLARTPAVKSEVERLLSLARRATRQKTGLFMHDDPRTLGALQALQRSFGAKPGSRADYLLSKLVKSAEIYSYNRRASTEPVGYFNNSVREDLFRENFLRHYREAAKKGPLPKVMFKQGMVHMYQGKSPQQAFTIGNFAHEFAFLNGQRAYGIAVFPSRGPASASAYEENMGWLRPLVPAQLPQQPVIIDLQSLKARWPEIIAQADPSSRPSLRDFLHGFDALVILPNSAKASWDLTGFPPR